uniref:B-block binding subunit of TFIIIC domain-containing protein n=1 Tax=Picocystis salinarum TaxID=88271 RepID=A0A7S3XE88_9CHLO|mmetsp:Transcript_6132/g.21639  ORF Transcript_6132/g.21639 Transcript_6132/m.21639 type:complete len:1641 (+) Transcript_6132:208-5130(+)
MKDGLWNGLLLFQEQGEIHMCLDQERMEDQEASPALCRTHSQLESGDTNAPHLAPESLDRTAKNSTKDHTSTKRGLQELDLLPERKKQKRQSVGNAPSSRQQPLMSSKVCTTTVGGKTKFCAEEKTNPRIITRDSQVRRIEAQCTNACRNDTAIDAGRGSPIRSVPTSKLPTTWKEAEKSGVILFAAQELQEAAMGIKAGFAPLSSVQAVVLQHVAKARWKGIPQADLAQVLGMQPRNFFQVAKGLERRGMIVRQGSAGSVSTPVVLFLSRFAPSQATPTRHDISTPQEARVSTSPFLSNEEGEKRSIQSSVQHGEGLPADYPNCKEAIAGLPCGTENLEQGHLTPWEDDMLLRMAMNFIRSSPDGIALERSIKIHLKLHEGTTSHRRWRRLRNRLLKGGIVEQVGLEKNKGAHACLKLIVGAQPLGGKDTQLLPSFMPVVCLNHVPPILTHRNNDLDTLYTQHGDSRKEASALFPCVVGEAPLDRQILSVVQQREEEGVTYNELFSQLGLPVKQNLHMIESLDKARMLDSSLESFGKHARYRLYLRGVWKNIQVILGSSSTQCAENKDFRQSSRKDTISKQNKENDSALAQTYFFEDCSQPLRRVLGSAANRFLPIVDEIQWSAAPGFDAFCTALMDLLPYHSTLPPVQATPRIRIRHGLLLAQARAMHFLLQIETGKLIRTWENTKSAIDLKTARRLVSSLLNSNLIRLVKLSITDPDSTQLQEKKVIRVLVPSTLNDSEIDWDKVSKRMAEFEKCKEGSAKLPLLDPSQCQHLFEMSRRTSRIMLDNHRSLLCSGFAWAKAIRARELHLWLIDWLDGRADDDCFTTAELRFEMDMQIFCLAIGTRENLLHLGELTPATTVLPKLWTAQASKRLMVLLKLLCEVGVLKPYLSSLPKQEFGQLTEAARDHFKEHQHKLCQEKFSLVSCIPFKSSSEVERPDSERASYSVGKKQDAISFWVKLKETLVHKEEPQPGLGWLARMPQSLKNPANWSETRLLPFAKRTLLLKWLSNNVVWRTEELQKESTWAAFITYAEQNGVSCDQARLILLDYAPSQFQDLLSMMFPRQARRSQENTIDSKRRGHVRVAGLSTSNKKADARKKFLHSNKVQDKEGKSYSPHEKNPRQRDHDLPIIKSWTVDNDRSLLKAYIKHRARTLGEGVVDWRAIPDLPTRVSLCKRRIAHLKNNNACWKLVNSMILHWRHSRTEHFQECLEAFLRLTNRYRYASLFSSIDDKLDIDKLSNDPVSACLANKLVQYMAQHGETLVSDLFADESLRGSSSTLQLQRALKTVEIFGACTQSGPQSNRMLKGSYKFRKLIGILTDQTPHVDVTVLSEEKQRKSMEGSLLNAQKLLFLVENLSLGTEDEWNGLISSCNINLSHPETWMDFTKHSQVEKNKTVCSQKFCNTLDCIEKLVPCNKEDLYDFLASLYASKFKPQALQKMSPALAESASSSLIQKIDAFRGISLEQATETLKIFVDEPLLFMEAMSRSGIIRLLNTFHGRWVFLHDSTSEQYISTESFTKEIQVSFQNSDFDCKQHFEYEYRPWQSSDENQQKRQIDRLVNSMLWIIYNRPGISEEDFLLRFQVIGPQNAYDVLHFLVSNGYIQVLDSSGLWLCAAMPGTSKIHTGNHFLSQFPVTVV